RDTETNLVQVGFDRIGARRDLQAELRQPVVLRTPDCVQAYAFASASLTPHRPAGSSISKIPSNLDIPKIHRSLARRLRRVTIFVEIADYFSLVEAQFFRHST